MDIAWDYTYNQFIPVATNKEVSYLQWDKKRTKWDQISKLPVEACRECLKEIRDARGIEETEENRVRVLWDEKIIFCGKKTL